MYVIKKNGLYVAKPGSRSSYTKYLQHARMFKTKEDAELNMCPENEYVVNIENEFT